MKIKRALLKEHIKEIYLEVLKEEDVEEADYKETKGQFVRGRVLYTYSTQRYGEA